LKRFTTQLRHGFLNKKKNITYVCNENNYAMIFP
jgi:hypothetical protein